MHSSRPIASLVLSIDVPGIKPSANSRPTPGELVAERLFEICERHRVPATWAVDRPTSSWLIRELGATRAGHEWALWADEAWGTSGAPRSRFSGELAARIVGADGPPISTVVLPAGAADAHFESLVRHSIRAVRRQRGPASANGHKSSNPRPIRPGLSEWTASLESPTRAGWWRARQWRLAAQQSIAEATIRGGAVHIVLDADAISQGSRPMLRAVDRVLAWASRLRQQNALVIETVGHATRRVRERPRPSYARSILAPAAA